MRSRFRLLDSLAKPQSDGSSTSRLLCVGSGSRYKTQPVGLEGTHRSILPQDDARHSCSDGAGITPKPTDGRGRSPEQLAGVEVTSGRIHLWASPVSSPDRAMPP